MARSMLSKCMFALQRFEGKLLQVLGVNGPFGPHQPALAYDVIPSDGALSNQNSSMDIKSIIDSIFDGFMWAAVPKKRRTREKRAMRKMSLDRQKKFMTPKKNILACLVCGHFHEAHTVCGNCYAKVKEETELMRSSMDQEERMANAPRNEVQFIYQNEEDERPKYKGKYIVEMEKPRPEWWSKHMLTKGHGSGHSSS